MIRKHRIASGFTLVELIIVILIMGILAAVALPRFFERKTFDATGFADQTRSMLQYAQKMAVAKRRNVCVTLTASTVALTLDTTGNGNNCNAPLPSPKGDASYTATAPNGITLSPAATFTFYPSGSDNLTQQLDISVNGDSAPRHIFVEQQTAYVHS